MVDKPAVSIDFDGPGGNTLAIAAACHRAARSAGWSTAAIEGFVQEMLSSDREHAINVVFDNFEVLQQVKVYSSVDRSNVR